MRSPTWTKSDVVWDNSASVERVPDASTFHPAMSELGSVPGVGEYLRSQSEPYEILSNLDSDEDAENVIESDSSSGSTEEHDDDDDLHVSRRPRGAGDPQNLEPLDRWRTIVEADSWEINDHFQGGKLSHAACCRFMNTDVSRGDEPSEETSVRDQLIANIAYSLQNESYLDATYAGQDDMFNSFGSPNQRSTTSPFPFRLLYTNEFDITLFNNRQLSSRVTCQDALHQKIPPRLHHLINFDRLNMIHQIPSLGVVAIASQAGRVALLTMTKMMKSRVENTSSLLGFRIEHILPLKSQEERGDRPEWPLLGMAIGPVQDSGIAGIDGSTGIEKDKEVETRYRLILIYYDHTIISYEISRSNSSGYELDDRVVII